MWDRSTLWVGCFTKELLRGVLSSKWSVFKPQDVWVSTCSYKQLLWKERLNYELNTFTSQRRFWVILSSFYRKRYFLFLQWLQSRLKSPTQNSTKGVSALCVDSYKKFLRILLSSKGAEHGSQLLYEKGWTVSWTHLKGVSENHSVWFIESISYSTIEQSSWNCKFHKRCFKSAGKSRSLWSLLHKEFSLHNLVALRASKVQLSLNLRVFAAMKRKVKLWTPKGVESFCLSFYRKIFPILPLTKAEVLSSTKSVSRVCSDSITQLGSYWEVYLSQQNMKIR